MVTLLAFDLGVLHKDEHEIGVRESLLLSAGYISVAVIFGAQSGMACYTGFMIEKSLSMDNVFVIALIFTFFAIPRQYRCFGTASRSSWASRRPGWRCSSPQDFCGWSGFGVATGRGGVCFDGTARRTKLRRLTGTSSR